MQWRMQCEFLLYFLKCKGNLILPINLIVVKNLFANDFFKGGNLKRDLDSDYQVSIEKLIRLRKDFPGTNIQKDYLW